MARKLFKMEKRPAGMDYGTYRASCAAKGMDPMDEDTYKALPVEGEEGADSVQDDDDGEDGGEDVTDEGGDEDSDEDDDDDDGFERSAAVGDLLKSLSAASAVRSAVDDSVSREDYLTARLRQSTITKSEQRELARIWNDGSDNRAPDAPLRKSLTEILDDEDARVVDASPILSALFNGLDGSLGDIRTDIAKSARESREALATSLTLNKSMARVIIDLESKLRKSAVVIDALGERLNILERQPRARRSVTTSSGKARPLAKSASGGGSGAERGGGQLHKGQVIQGLNTLTKSARDNGDQALAQRLVMATAAFESSGILDPGFRSAVQSLFTD